MRLRGAFGLAKSTQWPTGRTFIRFMIKGFQDYFSACPSAGSWMILWRGVDGNAQVFSGFHVVSSYKWTMFCRLRCCDVGRSGGANLHLHQLLKRGAPTIDCRRKSTTLPIHAFDGLIANQWKQGCLESVKTFTNIRRLNLGDGFRFFSFAGLLRPPKRASLLLDLPLHAKGLWSVPKNPWHRHTFAHPHVSYAAHFSTMTH